MRKAAGLALIALLACTRPADGQTSRTEAAPLSFPPDLFEGVAATPRLADTPLHSRFNADMARLDAWTVAERDSCLTAEMGQPYWERGVSLPMSGPRFVTVEKTEGSYCGGAHPNHDLMRLTYDLKTGEAIDWSSLLPPELLGSLSPDTMLFTLPTPTVRSAELASWYRGQVLAAMSEDSRTQGHCDEVLSPAAIENAGLVLWLDAETPGLAMEIASVAYADTVCLNPAVMPASELRSRGVSAELIDALEAAHANGDWRRED